MTYFDMRKSNNTILKIFRSQKTALIRLRLIEAIVAKMLK